MALSVRDDGDRGTMALSVRDDGDRGTRALDSEEVV